MTPDVEGILPGGREVDRDHGAEMGMLFFSNKGDLVEIQIDLCQFDVGGRWRRAHRGKERQDREEDPGRSGVPICIRSPSET